MIFYRSILQPQAITFDLDDTLYDNRPVMQKLENGMLKWLHQTHPISQISDLSYWRTVKQLVVQKNPELKHDVTKWRKAQLEFGLFKLGYAKAQAKKASISGVEQALQLRNQIEIPAQTHQVLTELACHLPLIAITNGNVDVDKIGLNDYFQFVLKSGVDGRAKPYPDMFHSAIKRLNNQYPNRTAVKLDRVLHVGDHLLTDVLGAKMAGLNAAWLNPEEKRLLNETDAKILPDIEMTSLTHLLALMPK